MKVAILGSNDRAALVTVRQLSLEPSISEILVVRHSKKRSLACVSKHTSQSQYYDFNQCDPELLIEQLKRHQVDMIIPINDITSLFVAEHYIELNKYFKLAAPKPQSYFRAIDKWSIHQLCDGRLLKYPQSHLVEKDREVNAVALEEHDVYFKTRYSVVYHDDQYNKYAVKKLTQHQDKLSFLHDHLARTDVICQKQLIGTGVGLNVLAHNGDVIALNQNERLHQPKDGGGSSYRQTSTKIPCELAEIAAKITKDLDWSGVMMIELLQTENGYYLIEINPRFWGSLALTEFCGANFVRNLYRQTSGLELLPSTQKEVRARHLLNDLKWLLRNLSFANLTDFLMSPLRVISRQEKYDVEQLSDLKPAFFQLAILSEQVFRTISQKLR